MSDNHAFLFRIAPAFAKLCDDRAAVICTNNDKELEDDIDQFLCGRFFDLAKTPQEEKWLRLAYCDEDGWLYRSVYDALLGP